MPSLHETVLLTLVLSAFGLSSPFPGFLTAPLNCSFPAFDKLLSALLPAPHPDGGGRRVSAFLFSSLYGALLHFFFLVLLCSFLLRSCFLTSSLFPPPLLPFSLFCSPSSLFVRHAFLCRFPCLLCASPLPPLPPFALTAWLGCSVLCFLFLAPGRPPIFRGSGLFCLPSLCLFLRFQWSNEPAPLGRALSPAVPCSCLSCSSYLDQHSSPFAVALRRFVSFCAFLCYCLVFFVSALCLGPFVGSSLFAGLCVLWACSGFWFSLWCLPTLAFPLCASLLPFGVPICPSCFLRGPFRASP